MNEAYFKQLNLIKNSSLDMDAAHKYVDSLIKVEEWVPVLKSSSTKCLDILAKQKNEIIAEFEKAPFNIKKEECNVFYMAFGWCVSMQMFEVNWWLNCWKGQFLIYWNIDRIALKSFGLRNHNAKKARNGLKNAEIKWKLGWFSMTKVPAVKSLNEMTLLIVKWIICWWTE